MGRRRTRSSSRKKYNLFVAHAQADKRKLVAHLVRELKKHMRVWYDDDIIKGGDPQLKMLNSGMRQSRRAIVIFSKAFLKNRPGLRHHEYHVLLGIEISQGRQDLIIPVLYGITHAQLAKQYPILADRFQLDFKKLRFKGLVDAIRQAVKPVKPRVPKIVFEDRF